MSEILNRLKRAEAERVRFIAERRRIEAEADAALAAREREELVTPQPPAPRRAAPVPRSRLLAGLAALAFVAAASVALLFSGEDRTAKQAAPAGAAAAPVPAAQSGLKLDRDVEGFAARVREKEPQ